jgi:hypothetical protein
MRSHSDKGQIYTMEGVTSAFIILGVLLFIIEANSLVVPQTAKVVDMKLGELSNDVLTSMDWNSNDSWSTTGSLSSYVAGWNGHTVTYSNNVPDPGLAVLNSNIATMLLQDDKYPQGDVQYNLEFFYINNTGKHTDLVIINGEPGDNSMVATRLVTLNENDPLLSSFWKNSGRFPQVVQVRIICWHL